MRAGDHLSQAKDQALNIRALKPGDQAQVVALGGTGAGAHAAHFRSGELRAAVAVDSAGRQPRRLSENWRAIRGTLSESVQMPIEVHLASDLQKTAMPPGFADLRLDPDTTLVLHQIGQAAPNWAVENVVAPRRVYD